MKLKDIPSNYSYIWKDSISEISAQTWAEIFGTSVIKGYNFYKAADITSFSNVRFHYLCIYNKNRIKAIVACYTYKIDLKDLSKSSAIQWIINKIRRFFFTDFLCFKTFVIGSYPATCEHFIGFLPCLSESEKIIISNIINISIKKKAHEEKTGIVFVKDVRSRYYTEVASILSSDYTFVSSFPTNLIPIITTYPYPMALKKKNRKRVKIYQVKFNNSFLWEVSDECDKYIPVFYKLYRNVLNVAKNKFETLTEDFYKNLYRNISQSMFFLIARDKKTSEIRLIELIIVEKNKLIPLYLGIKYKDDDTKVLYLNVIFKTIEIATENHMEIVDFGQTSYYPKTMSGTFAEDILYGFYAPNKIVNYILKHTIGKIILPAIIPNNVYQKETIKTYKTYMVSNGINIINI